MFFDKLQFGKKKRIYDDINTAEIATMLFTKKWRKFGSFYIIYS